MAKGGEKVIDPFTALAAVNTAIKLVKTMVKTVHNLESLGPVLGEFFAAEEQAIAVVAKGGFKGSALGQAIELELAIERAKVFKESIKMLFFQANKMDVWQKIEARAKQISADQRLADKKASKKKANAKQEMQENIDITLLILAVMAALGVVGYGAYEMIDYCRVHRCGG